MIPCLKIWGSLTNLQVKTFLCIITFYLSAHASILKLFEECPKSVPYRKMMVVWRKFGAYFTIGRLVINGFCYIFCFMGILQCCVACC